MEADSECCAPYTQAMRLRVSMLTQGVLDVAF